MAILAPAAIVAVAAAARVVSDSRCSQELAKKVQHCLHYVAVAVAVTCCFGCVRN